MKVETYGPADLGMTLADVRIFVEHTKDMDETTWVDCKIPSQTEGELQVAALMGLEASS